jgi:hypothetical protein
LFSQQEHPVFISPVYGCLIEKDQHDVQAYPHVPSLKRVQWFPGLRDLEPDEYPSSFTVVPILALNTAAFAQILYTGRNETHLGLCKKLIEFNPESGESVTSFRCQSRLIVIGGETEVPAGWLDGYCAFKALCVHHGAETPTTSSDPQHPGCGLAVHAECGYFRSNADNKWESVTCFMCFKHYGRALRAVTGHTHSKQKADASEADKSPINDNQDGNTRKFGPPDLSPALKKKPDGSSAEESSKQKADESEVDNSLVNEESSKQKADESEADNSLVNKESSKQKAGKSEADNSSINKESSKQKADKSEADNSSVNDNSDENTRKIGSPYASSGHNSLDENPCQVGPSDFIRGQRPSGFSLVIKSHSTSPPKSLTPSQLKKNENMTGLWINKILPTCIRLAALHGPQQATMRLNGV